MVRILSCIISLLFLFSFPARTQKDPLRRSWIGLDVLPFAKTIYGSQENSAEAALGRAVGKNRYLMFEGGLSDVHYKGSNFIYTSNGWFVKSGIDFNVLRQKKFASNDQVLIGFRYAFSRMHYQADEIRIWSPYWPTYSTHISSTGFGNHWLEAKAGIRAEIFPRVFIGWSVAGRILLVSGHMASMDPYTIAGFGDGTRKATIGFQYYIYLNL